MANEENIKTNTWVRWKNSKWHWRDPRVSVSTRCGDDIRNVEVRVVREGTGPPDLPDERLCENCSRMYRGYHNTDKNIPGVTGYTAQEYFRAVARIKAMTPEQRAELQGLIQKDFPEGLRIIVHPGGYTSILGGKGLAPETRATIAPEITCPECIYARDYEDEDKWGSPVCGMCGEPTAIRLIGRI